ncbi:MAG: ferredoxin family protein [Candidatus Thorarchaeota archaeon]
MTIVLEDVGLEIEYNRQKCNRCGICLEVCPFGVWEMPEEGPAVLARIENCTNCTACAKNCLGGAIAVRNIGCGCIWNEAARRRGDCEESVVRTSNLETGSHASKCCSD